LVASLGPCFEKESEGTFRAGDGPPSPVLFEFDAGRPDAMTCDANQRGPSQKSKAARQTVGHCHNSPTKVLRYSDALRDLLRSKAGFPLFGC
jgi:hypothetical protein